MSSRGSGSPLRIELRPSRLLQGAILGIHGGAALLVLTLPLPLPLLPLLLLCLAAVAGAIVHLRRSRHGRDSHAVRALYLAADGRWTLVTHQGESVDGSLRADSYLHPWLTVLNFSGPRPRTIVLLPDSLDRDVFRRLRVRLRLQGQAASSR